jgi:hypothetical protein
MPLYSFSKKERLPWGIITDLLDSQYLSQNILNYHASARFTPFEAQINPRHPGFIKSKSASTNPVAYLDFITPLFIPSIRLMLFISILATLAI